MYFYELHEGDEDLMTDVIVACETEVSPDDFFELVQEVRHQVQDSHEEDSLLEAIAAGLERDHGFIFVSDDRLVASVLVSARDEENLLITAEPDDEFHGYDDLDDLPDYRAIIADLDPGTAPD